MELSVRALPVAPRPLGWMRTIGAVVLGFVVATVAALLAVLPLGALHLVPLNTDLGRGQGWPWPIHGPWSLLADAGPLVGLSLVLAACTAWYLPTPDNRALPRWPLALTSVVVGWLPLVGPHGVIGASAGFAFAATVVVARRVSRMERGPRWFSRRTRIVVALGAAAVLAAVTFTYGALNPLSIRANGISRGPATHVHGIRAQRLQLQLVNGGPFTATVLDVRLVGAAAGVRLLRVDVENPHARAHTIDELFMPMPGLVLHPGAEKSPLLVLAGTGCAPASALDVRMRLGGVTRTQRVWIPGGRHLGCSAP